jgi:hypothetical protein
LCKTDEVIVILNPTPLEIRQMTRVSLRHCVDAQAVFATRARPDQSERPALLPYTSTVICAVEGYTDGVATEMTRGCKISGNSILDCVSSGHPFSKKEEILKVDEAAPGIAAFVNPSIVHTIAAGVDAGAAVTDKLSSKTPDDAVKAASINEGDGLMLEQKGAAADALNAEKRNPLMDMSLILIELSKEGTMNDTVKMTWLEAAP